MARRLVVVGNGMAGVRAIEEILARGGGELFDITVFGDEPYGNYNRILLSNVLAGSQQVDDQEGIYLNALDWYRDNNIDLRAGVRVVRIDRYARLVQADDGTVTRYDNLILATGSRSFFPPMAGLWADDKTLADGVFGFRSLDDCLGMISQAEHRTKAVVIGGGLLGSRGGPRAAEPRSGRRRRPCRSDSDECATRRHRRCDSATGRSSVSASLCTLTSAPPRCRTDDGRLRGIVFSDGQFHRLRHAGDRCRHPTQRRTRAAVGSDRGACHRRRRPHALGRRRRRVRRRRMRAASRPGVRTGGTAVGAGGRAGRPHHRRRQVVGLSRVAHGDETQGRRRRCRVDGAQGARTARRRVRPVFRTEARCVQDDRDPRRKAGRRNAAR